MNGRSEGAEKVVVEWSISEAIPGAGAGAAAGSPPPVTSLLSSVSPAPVFDALHAKARESQRGEEFKRGIEQRGQW